MTTKVFLYRKKRGIIKDKASEKAIRDAIRTTLREEGFPFSAEVSVSVTDDEGIREINSAHRGIDRPTDVLSFPMCEFQNGKPAEDLRALFDTEGAVFLGDIVLSAERAQAQAEEYGHGILREFGFLTVHSMLHLLGYDHERGDEDTALMRKREEEILSLMNLSR